MIGRGIDEAMRARRILGKRPATAEAACARFGVPVYRVPLAGRLRAIYAEGAIGVRLGLDRSAQQHAILHELGHHLMHAEIADARAWLARDGATFSRVEREAEAFAFHLTVTDAELARYARDGWDDAAIAAYYGRAPAWVAERRAQTRTLMPLPAPLSWVARTVPATLILAGMRHLHVAAHAAQRFLL
jgi:hypothetical protein